MLALLKPLRAAVLLYPLLAPGGAFGTPPAPLAAPAAAPADREAADRSPADGAGRLDGDWVRFARDAKGRPESLQTAIRTYRGPGPGGATLAVDLVGVIHVGDAAYYERLNERFPRYDAVLYELVAPRGTIVPRGGRGRSDNPLSAMQNGMKSALALEHQLDRVDYTRPNFVHADLSPEELWKAMSDRGEGIVQMYFRMLGQSIAAQTQQAAQGESTEVDLFKALFAPDRSRQLKIALAGQLSQIEGLLGGFGGEDGSALIHDRNRAALAVLREQISAGKRNVAVFYGAGHMPDLDERLREDFGLTPAGPEWLAAWDLQ